MCTQYYNTSPKIIIFIQVYLSLSVHHYLFTSLNPHVSIIITTFRAELIIICLWQHLFFIKKYS